MALLLVSVVVQIPCTVLFLPYVFGSSITCIVTRMVLAEVCMKVAHDDWTSSELRVKDVLYVLPSAENTLTAALFSKELHSISGPKQAYLDSPPSLKKIVFIGEMGNGCMVFVGHPYLWKANFISKEWGVWGNLSEELYPYWIMEWNKAHLQCSFTCERWRPNKYGFIRHYLAVAVVYKPLVDHRRCPILDHPH